MTQENSQGDRNVQVDRKFKMPVTHTKPGLNPTFEYF